MSWAPWLAVAVAVLLSLWAVGAHNRVVALRAAIGTAWAPFDEALQRREAALAPLAVQLREPLAAEHPALDAVVAALARVRAAADAVRPRPLLAAPLAALRAEEAQLAAAQARVLALLDARPEVRAEPDVAARVAEAADAAQRMAAARQWFNDAAAAHDAAIAQWPTRLLMPGFRFGAAGRL